MTLGATSLAAVALGGSLAIAVSSPSISGTSLGSRPIRPAQIQSVAATVKAAPAKLRVTVNTPEVVTGSGQMVTASAIAAHFIVNGGIIQAIQNPTEDELAALLQLI